MAHIDATISTGRRLYVRTAYGEPVVAGLKSLGAHWDGAAKAWWISPTKRAAVEELLVGADKAAEEAPYEPAKPEDVTACRVYARVTHGGRPYYVIAETKDLTRCRITTLDGAAPRWVDCADCELIRRYEGRERWDGRRYSGKTITVYPTIGSLREFRNEQRQGEKDGLPACPVCGKRSNNLVHDLETGMEACRGCADMPAD